MNEQAHNPDRKTSGNAAADSINKDHRNAARTKVPPDNQRTPGEGGEKSGGGLQGA